MRLLYGTTTSKKILPLSPSHTYSEHDLYEQCQQKKSRTPHLNFYLDFDGEEIKIPEDNLQFACMLCCIYHHKSQEHDLKVSHIHYIVWF